MPPTKKLILLDRDGVINRMVPSERTHTGFAAPSRVQDVQLMPGVPDALAQLNRAGYGLSIVTNQPDAAKGWVSYETIEMIHAEILKQISVAQVQILSSHLCLHKGEDGCICRKPLPGMLDEAFAQNPEYTREGSWMIGDRAVDIQAGLAAKVNTAFVGPREPAMPDFARLGCAPHKWHLDLPDFVSHLLKREGKGTL